MRHRRDALNILEIVIKHLKGEELSLKYILNKMLRSVSYKKYVGNYYNHHEYEVLSLDVEKWLPPK